VRRETGRLGLATNGVRHQDAGCGGPQEPQPRAGEASMLAGGTDHRMHPVHPLEEVLGPAGALRWHATFAVRSVTKRTSHYVEVNFSQKRLACKPAGGG